MTLDEWISILDRFERRCVHCGNPFKELDHIIPLEAGGATIASNVVPSCIPCNRRKSAVRIDIVHNAFVSGYIDGYLQSCRDRGTLSVEIEAQIRSEIRALLPPSEFSLFAGVSWSSELDTRAAQ